MRRGRRSNQSGRDASEKRHDLLSSKKDLILHSYDSFLIAQTRLFTLSCSRSDCESAEIKRRQELLLLDDRMIFAIAARRLIELTRLKSKANKSKVQFAFLDQREEPYVVGKLATDVGFLTLVNKIIHASTIQYFNTKRSLVSFIVPVSREHQMELLMRRVVRRKFEEEMIEPLLFLSSEEGAPALISIGDLIQTSIEVAEAIIEVCSREKIFLELDYRGAD